MLAWTRRQTESRHLDFKSLSKSSLEFSRRVCEQEQEKRREVRQWKVSNSRHWLLSMNSQDSKDTRWGKSFKKGHRRSTEREKNYTLSNLHRHREIRSALALLRDCSSFSWGVMALRTHQTSSFRRTLLYCFSIAVGLVFVRWFWFFYRLH